MSNQKWRLLFAWGDVEHPSGGFSVDMDFWRGLKRSFDALKKEHRYLPPLTADHPEIIAEILSEAELRGANYGMVTGLRIDEDGIWGAFTLNEIGQRLSDMNALAYLSPSFYRQWVDPHTGNTLGPVLREVSFVGVPYQKNISGEVGAVYGLADAVALSELGFVTNSTEAVMVEETATEEVVETEEMAGPDMAALDAKLDAILALLQPAEMAEDEEQESTDMGERVASLEKELKREKAANAVRSDLGASATDELVKSLVAVKLSDSDAYKTLLDQVKKSPASSKPAGSAGTNQAVTSLSEPKFISLTEEAAKSGVKRGLGLVKFLRSKGIEQDKINTCLAEYSDQISRVYAVHAGGN